MEHSESTLQIGKYKFIAALNQGGMSELFLAVTTEPAGLIKLHAVKVLKKYFASNIDFTSMFHDEARLAMKLNHLNIVHTSDAGEEHGERYIVMEFLKGQTLQALRNRSKDKGGIPLHICLFIFTKILSALHYVHELKSENGSSLDVIHRDVSPQNIFITYDGQPKLVDFGIAKSFVNDAETAVDVFKGKVVYCAPEQIQNKQIDRRVDIFAVGVMLFEALTNTRMWKGFNDRQVVTRLRNNDVPTSPKAINPNVPNELESICKKALAPERSKRYATAAAFQADLEQFLARSIGNTDTLEHTTAQFISTHFSKEYELLQQTIETQLSKLRSLSTEQYHLATIAPHDATIGDPSSVTAAGMIAHAFDAQPSWPPTVARKYKNIFFVVGAAAAIAISIISYGALSRKTKPNPVPLSPSSTSPSIAATQTNLIEFVVSASPEHVQLFLDDAPLPSNPYSGKFLKDGVVHRIRAEAVGYVGASRLVNFNKSESIFITLHPIVATEPKPVESTQAPVASAAPQPNVSVSNKPSSTPSKPNSKPPSTSPDPITGENPWQ